MNRADLTGRARRLKAGVLLLWLWSGINFLFASGIVVAMTFFDRNPPSVEMFLTEAEVAAIQPNVLALIKTLALLLNGSIAALCLLLVVVTWRGLLENRARWAFWALATSMGLVQACGFACDVFLAHRNIVANVVSTAVLLAGLALAGTGRRQATSAHTSGYDDGSSSGIG